MFDVRTAPRLRSSRGAAVDDGPWHLEIAGLVLAHGVAIRQAEDRGAGALRHSGFQIASTADIHNAPPNRPEAQKPPQRGHFDRQSRRPESNRGPLHYE